MRFSLPSIKCSAAPPSFRLCCLNCTRRFDLITARSAVVGSWKEPPNIWLTVAKNEFLGWDLNFRVRMLLKSAVRSWPIFRLTNMDCDLELNAKVFQLRLNNVSGVLVLERYDYSSHIISRQTSRSLQWLLVSNSRVDIVTVSLDHQTETPQ